MSDLVVMGFCGRDWPKCRDTGGSLLGHGTEGNDKTFGGKVDDAAVTSVATSL